MADLDALQEICRAHDLWLLEDACQSIGGTYKGKKLGTIGDAGTFSFDFVKTMTCGEGGVVMTNNAEIYVKSDGYTDHGHDHLGVDRGADLHPFVGYNFRISELHSAVGLAQIRRLPEFLEAQRKNHTALKSHLMDIPGITFRRVPDPLGDSCSFISWFLPTAEQTQRAVDALREAGILAGNFYWYNNNWHYIRKWDHLKKGLTLNRLSPELMSRIEAEANKDFSVSDAIMSRCVSTAISLLWTEEQIREKGTRMSEVIQAAI
jgi:8-amino-3,8-dideoxy-alpha-D-manno-octulosonate transaminase